MFFLYVHKRRMCSDHDDEALARNAISICYGHTYGVFDPKTDSPLVRILYNSWTSGNARDRLIPLPPSDFYSDGNTFEKCYA